MKREREREHLKADNVGMFLENFHIEHEAFKIKISSESGSYGKTLAINFPAGDANKLQMALYEVFAFSQKPRSRVTQIGAWHDAPALTTQQINELPLTWKLHQ